LESEEEWIVHRELKVEFMDEHLRIVTQLLKRTPTCGMFAHPVNLSQSEEQDENKAQDNSSEERQGDNKCTVPRTRCRLVCPSELQKCA
jgi:hypothetical protein